MFIFHDKGLIRFGMIMPCCVFKIHASVCVS